jgi:uncharacterized repeat protein (TIGR03806 family)
VLRAIAGATVALLCMGGCGAGAGPGPGPDALSGLTPPERLSALNFFEPPAAGEVLRPAAGVEPYDLVNALFSDHAVKDRHLYLPPGATVAYDPAGVLGLPVGSALIKTFSLAPDLRDPRRGARRIETRVLLHRPEGWVAWPYVWDEDQREARYSPAGAQRAYAVRDPTGKPMTIAWSVPNRNQCKNCHQSGDSIAPLGPTARNLNRPAGGARNQLDDWAARGLLAGAPSASLAPRVPDAFDAAAPLAARARAWLDVNCAHCHQRAGSASNSGLYLGWSERSETALGLGKRPVAAGRGAGDGHFVIDPGHPQRSIMVHRMDSTEAGVAMPELGRSVPDPEGVALIGAWIASMGT